MRRQANARCARRSAPPNAIRLAMLHSPVTSTAECQSDASNRAPRQESGSNDPAFAAVYRLVISALTDAVIVRRRPAGLPEGQVWGIEQIESEVIIEAPAGEAGLRDLTSS